MGECPTIEEILTIKQLGLYTAGAILSLGYNKPSPMVDSNVVRILTRYYGKRISQTQAFHLLSHVLPDSISSI